MSKQKRNRNILSPIGRVCECGNKATVVLRGREYVCDRCLKMEKLVHELHKRTRDAVSGTGEAQEEVLDFSEYGCSHKIQAKKRRTQKNIAGAFHDEDQKSVPFTRDIR